MSGSLQPFGSGLYSAGRWPNYRVVQISGLAQIAFAVSGEMELTWAVPTQMCETGTWALTSLPSGPQNDQLELAA